MPHEVLRGSILDKFYSERKIWLRGYQHNAEEQTAKVGISTLPAIQLKGQEVAAELLHPPPSCDNDGQGGDPGAFLALRQLHGGQTSKSRLHLRGDLLG